jgi:hypothetical protein
MLPIHHFDGYYGLFQHKLRFGEPVNWWMRYGEGGYVRIGCPGLHCIATAFLDSVGSITRSIFGTTSTFDRDMCRA